MIAKSLAEIASVLAAMSEVERIAALNRIRAQLHQASPFAGEPVDCVLWLPADTVEANDYNPNVVAPPEMRLLQHSVREDGYTQPIVGFDEGDHVEVNEDRLPAVSIGALPSPDAGDHDNAVRAGAEHGVALFDAFDDMKRDVRILEVFQAARRDIQVEPDAFRMLVFQDTFFKGTIGALTFRFPGRVRPEQVVVDVTSIKEAPVAMMHRYLKTQ